MPKKTDYNKLASSIDSSLNAKTRDSLLTLLNYRIDMQNNRLWPDDFVKPAVFSDLESYITESIKALHKTVLLADHERVKLVDELKQKRKEIETVFKPVCLYHYELSKYRDILFARDIAHDLTDLPVSEQFVPESKNKIDDYTQHCLENEIDLFKAIGDILAMIPMNIARDKYFDIIKSSFVFMLSGSSEDDMRKNAAYLSELAYPPASADYTNIIPEIFNGLKELRQLTESPGTLTEALELFDRIDDEMQPLYEYTDLIYSASGELLILYINNDVSESLFQNNPELKDTYFLTNEYVGTDEYELYEESIDKAIDDMFTQSYTDVNDIDTNILKKLNSKVLEEAPAEFLEKFKIYIECSYFIYSKLFDNVFSFDNHFKIDESKEFMTDQAALEIGSELVALLKQAFAACPVKLQKNMRRLLYKEMQINMTPENFYPIFTDALTAMPTNGEKLAFAKTLTEYFESNNFYADDNNSGEWENEIDFDNRSHHHIHGDDCGCEHNH